MGWRLVEVLVELIMRVLRLLALEISIGIEFPIFKLLFFLLVPLALLSMCSLSHVIISILRAELALLFEIQALSSLSEDGLKHALALHYHRDDLNAGSLVAGVGNV